MRAALAFVLLFATACKPEPPATPAPEPAPPWVEAGAEKYPPSVAWGLPAIRGGQRLTPVRFNLTVGPRTIQLDGVDVAPLPSDMSHGLDASYKRDGQADLYINPLADGIERARKGEPSNNDAARIEIGPDVANRVFVEIAYTLGQNGVASLHLVAPSAGGDVPKGQLAEIVSAGPPAGRGPGKLGLTVIVVPDGISLKARGGNVGPGCNDTGPGLAFTRHGSDYPFADVAACAAKLKAAAGPEFANDSEVVVMANPGIPFRDVMGVIGAVHGERRELFPDVKFGIAR